MSKNLCLFLIRVVFSRGIFIFLILFANLSIAQSYMVNQGFVSVSSGTTVSVSGNVVNNAGATVDFTNATSDMNATADVTNNGTIESRGNMTLGGNWYNNATFNAYTGTVLFNGTNQQLSGTNSTLFYNLDLSNSGIKSQTINESVGGTLNLNSIELATGAFTMFVTNPLTAAIQRVSGFVSSTLGGALSWQTNSVATYLFPVGSSSGTVRYRPVSLTPAAATANTFEVRMANVNPTSEGFNIATHEAVVCQVNSLFYHLINHTVGSNNADVVVYYDNTADGSWDAMGNWLTSPSAQWYEIVGSSTAVGAPLYTATALGQTILNSDRPFALTKHSLIVDLGADTSLCSGETIGLDAGNPGAAYNWSTGVFSQTISVTTANTYIVTVTNPVNGCQTTDSIQVSFIPVADATIVPVGPFCDNNAVETLLAADNGGVWSGSGITNTSNGTFDPSVAGPGSHNIIYIIAGACGDSDTITIDVNETPDVDIYSVVESCAGANDGSAYISISGGTIPYNILWNTSDTDDSLGMLSPGLYSVMVSDFNGCVRNMSVTVDASTDSCYIPHVYIPNIFSPNADGNNDIYIVQGKGISSITIRIFDRWGEKVFETFDRSEGWNGEFKGKPVEQGVYPYVISIVFENETEAKVYNGYLTIVR